MKPCDMEQPPHEGCKDCPLYTKGQYVPPSGSGLAPYVVVGEAPGAEEVSKRRPFVGTSGRILKGVMRSIGMDPGNVLYTNTVSCRPPSNRDPSPAEMEACAPLLNKLLKHSRASVVLAVGRVALIRFIGKDRLSELTGRGGKRACWDQYVHDVPRRAHLGRKYGRYGHPILKGPNKGKRKKVTTDIEVATHMPEGASLVGALHPAAVMRGWKDLPSFVSALGRAQELQQGEPVYDGPTDMVEDIEDIDVSAARVVAFDIENIPDTGEITDISLATDAGQTGSWPWTGHVADVIREMLEPEEGPVLVAHNAVHDVKYLAQAGIDVAIGRVHDTMMMAYLDEPDLRKALGHVAPRFKLMRPWKHKMSGDMRMYNAEDSEVTLHLYLDLAEELQDKGMWQLFTNIVMPATFKLAELTERGIAVDPDKKDAWKHELEAEFAKREVAWNEACEAACGETVNPNSPKQLQHLFFDVLGLDPIDRTDSGAPSVAVGVVEKLAKKSDSPVFPALLALRQTSKLLSTYVKQLSVHDDGKVHPRYLPESKDAGDFGAASGRLSSQSPNIQNQPHVARYMYVPSIDRGVIWARDYSQIEARLVAILADDRDLMAAYDEGRDRHQETADFLSRELGRPVDRKEAKGYRHGLNYGMGPRMLADHSGVALGVARKVIAAMRKLEPKVFAWQEAVALKAAQQNYLANPFLRRRNFPGFADTKTKLKHVRNSAVNFIPQSTVADITLAVIVELDERLTRETKTGRLLTQIHDEFMGECAASEVEKVEAITLEVMEQVFENVAPGWFCPTEFSVGPNWASCKDYDAAANAAGVSPIEAWRQDGQPVWRQ